MKASKPRVANAFDFDTPRGFRSVNLLIGSIADVTGSHVVRCVSTHANPTKPLFGGAIEALGIARDAELEPVVLIDPRSAAGTWKATTAQGDTALVVRIPAPTASGTHGTYQRSVRSLFLALSALEREGREYDTVAMTELGGAREFEIALLVPCLLDEVTSWLATGVQAKRVDIVLLDHRDAWSDAMDTYLQRTKLDTANHTALTALADELLDIIACQPLVGTDELRWKIVEPLREALAPERRRSLRAERLGGPGRLLAEHATDTIERLQGRKPRGSLYERIEAANSSSPSVPPWIIQHLHVLRVFGNEDVHLKGRPGPTISDLTAQLASLVAVARYAQNAPRICRDPA